MMNRSTLYLSLSFAILSLTGCDKQESTSSTTTPSAVESVVTSPATESLQQLSKLSFRNTTELLHLSHKLHIEIANFLKSPSEQELKKAQQAYDSLLLQWAQSLPFVYMTALTNNGAPLVNRIEKLPILPGYLDQIPDYPFSGLVHDIMVPIDATSLTLLHTPHNDEQVIFGLSALEFLLYDHFNSDHYKKFVTQTELLSKEVNEDIRVDQLPNNRRRDLLKLQSDQLVKDLSELHKRWQPMEGEDTKKFIMLTGKNLNLTLTRSYQKSAYLVLDALNSIQEKPLLLGRAHFSRTEKPLLTAGITSLEKLHQQLNPIWNLHPQPEKEEFTAVLDSLIETVEQYQQDPANSLLLELASNRSNQLIELSKDLVFQPK